MLASMASSRSSIGSSSSPHHFPSNTENVRVEIEQGKDGTTLVSNAAACLELVRLSLLTSLRRIGVT